MRVGLTYDLRAHYLARGFDEEQTAEFDAPETIDALERALGKQGFSTERIGNLEALAARLIAGERWDWVFNIAEGLRGPGREAQVPALLDAWGLPYCFSDPVTMSVTLDKSMAKRVVRDQGIPTAPFVLIESLDDLKCLDLDCSRLSYPLFAKPVAEGTGKGIGPASRAGGPRELGAVCTSLLERFRQPVLVEAYLPGRELTVGILGTGRGARVLGVMEVRIDAAAGQGDYSFDNKEHYEGRVSYRLAADDEAMQAADTALTAWRTLRCRDAGRVDLRADAKGVPQFLEVNPLAGLHPVRSDLVILARLAGYDYQALIAAIVDAFLARNRMSRPIRAPAVG
jgi:D-alanine-D-alanine ligase